jgi:hypothetical protein
MIPTIKFSPLEIIYNKIHPSIKLHLKEKPMQLMTIHIVQEIKRDIIYKRLNTNANQQGRNPTRIRAHLLSTIKKMISVLAYQGTRNFQDSVNFLTLLETAVTNRV